ncbi:transcriptional regulator [Thiohalobacter sp. COW1]|uniref:helix-turn-helix domain-containing protein n=1 Tax=Thiohalobacter sp. COW1 TaxID=2795687 RepID=UPI0019167442|nr:helix-turn-helix transcriptional regulator [Thiohalobacter sp. COW1]BCO30026.1 transcriptional regulator [Thiohalobacter sp. COW1]
MSDNELGNRISELRKSKGLTLEGLAKKIGSTKSYVWELENKPGIRPSAETVYKIAVALETTVEDLMGKPINADDVQDQVFFREYQGLKQETKKQLKSILDALKQSK